MSNKNCPCVREFFYLSASTIVRITRCVTAYTQTEQTWGNNEPWRSFATAWFFQLLRSDISFFFDNLTTAPASKNNSAGTKAHCSPAECRKSKARHSAFHCRSCLNRPFLPCRIPSTKDTNLSAANNRKHCQLFSDKRCNTITILTRAQKLQVPLRSTKRSL